MPAIIIFLDTPDLAAGLRISLGELDEGVYTIRLQSEAQSLSGIFVKTE